MRDHKYMIVSAFVAFSLLACGGDKSTGPKSSPSLASITIAPNPASIAAGATQQFTAVGKDSSGNVVDVATVWSVDAGGGTIDSGTGLFTAGTSLGTFGSTVQATSGSVSATSSVTIVPGSLATIAISPTTATLAAGTTQQFTAVGKDASGNVVSITPTWTVAAGGGTINSSGLFTAATAGTFSNTVNATSGTVSGNASVTVLATPPTSGRWISGYWVGYQRSLYPETQVDFSILTHILVGAIEPTSTGGVTTDFYIDNVNGPLVAKTLSSRAHQAGRKAILMLGGAGALTNLLSATSNTYRATFVANLLKTMDDLSYDGIDVDWEPLNGADKPQILQFLQDLRAARPGMLITFPIGWVSSNGGADSWYAQVAPLVDQLNVMSYGMADNWGGWVSWHQGALYGEAANHPSSVSSTINAYVSVGIPAAKLGIGLGFYGSCWRGTNAMLQTLSSSAGVYASDNAMSYTNIMAQYYNAANYHWDATARSGYLGFTTATGPQLCTLVSYEDEQSIGEKGAYVKSAGVGGAIIWTINQGHLPNAPAGSQDPLMTAAYNSIVP